MPIRYVFCINPGRSGSEYLARVLGCAAGAIGAHEAFPVMNGRPMLRFNDGDEAELRALMPAKAKAIAKRHRRDRVYFETNHSFIKGWGYLFPDIYAPQCEIGVIVLRRDPEKVAASLLRVRDVPGLTAWSRAWYLTPNAKHDLHPLPAGATPLDRCRWYVREVGLRADDYKRRFPNVTYFDATLEELNDIDTVRRMLAAFGLEPGPRLEQVVGTPTNAKDEWPRWPLEELTAPPQYPSADDLPPAERDALLANQLEYLRRKRGPELAALPPDPRYANTRLLGVTRVLADAERELEDAFGRALLFTDYEHTLRHELLRSVAPRDPAFLIHRRTGPPGVGYEFEYNRMPSLGALARTFGVLGTAGVIWKAARGKLGDSDL